MLRLIIWEVRLREWFMNNVLCLHKDAQKCQLIYTARRFYQIYIRKIKCWNDWTEFFRKYWRNFFTENHIIDSKRIEEFNQKASEESLLKTADDFLLQLEKISLQNPAKQIDLNHTISHFTWTYLYHFQQTIFYFLDLKYIEDQKRLFDQILSHFQSLENTFTFRFINRVF